MPIIPVTRVYWLALVHAPHDTRALLIAVFLLSVSARIWFTA